MRTNIQVLRDPAIAEGVCVTWEEPQKPDRPESAHLIAVHPYFDWARNADVARLIAEALAEEGVR